MIQSLGIIFVTGLIFSKISNFLKIPSIILLIFSGILLGSEGFSLIGEEISDNAVELRKIALVIILIRGGLSLKLEDFKNTGRTAFLLSFLPAISEIMAVFLIAPLFFDFTKQEALLLGSVLSAVSPAIVMPRMINLIDLGYGGNNKKIPQMIIAGASLDDILVLTLFSAFLSNISNNGGSFLGDLAKLPITILLGGLLGLLSGYLLIYVFNNFLPTDVKIKRNSKILWLLGVSFLLVTIESLLEDIISISGLLAIIIMIMTICKNINLTEKNEISTGFFNLWSGAEIILFTLVGCEIRLSYIKDLWFVIVIFIIIVLIFRCIGVYLCTLGSNLNLKERLFCIFAYSPKATVQAAIGSIPLSLGLECGELILSISVISILLTAPLGAFLIDSSYKKFLIK